MSKFIEMVILGNIMRKGLPKSWKRQNICNNANQIAEVANNLWRSQPAERGGNDRYRPSGLERSKGELVTNLRLDAICAHMPRYEFV